MLARQARYEVERYRGGVGNRLVFVPNEPRKLAEEVLLVDHHFVTHRSESVRHLAGVLELAEGPLVECHREGRDRPADVARHERGDDARVDPAGKKDAEGHVAHQPERDRFFQELTEPPDDVRMRLAARDGMRRRLDRDVPVTRNRHLPVIEAERVTRQKLVDAGEEGLRARDVPGR